MNSADDAYITDARIRAELLNRSDRFCALTGKSKSVIGKQAVNDAALLKDVEEGRNFTVGTYQRVMDWLSENWPAPETISQG